MVSMGERKLPASAVEISQCFEHRGVVPKDGITYTCLLITSRTATRV